MVKKEENGDIGNIKNMG